ncbi:MAG TPA: serine hydrolase domain-containing protein [Mycobacteriales bacterium]|nr:serine hydrolase domain-containing protein [Mycobacteriales bacterium]
MARSELQDKLDELATELGVPGAAAGVVVDGEEHYAYAGVTSVENPLPVDETTLFQFGSTGKTYTATAIMRLAEQGKVDLDAPVRDYVPELRLKDESVAEKVTVLQLLNHTAGWQGDLIKDTGNGDDALARYVDLLADIDQISPLGATVSYNNASLSLAGRLIEHVTGTTFEQAIGDLLLTPLGLTSTWFFPGDIISRRFAVGHKRAEDGAITIARPWAMPRSAAAAGGMSANARDQIAWATFHLGDGTAADGTRVLSEESVKRMQQGTADMRGSALGDEVGIAWLLAEVGGVKTVGHGGTTNGQYSDFTLVPERGFGAICMSNCGPNGSQLNHGLVKWAMEHFLGLKNVEPETLRLTVDQLAAYTGRYESISALIDVTAYDGRLSAKVEIKPEMLEALTEAGEEVPEQPPIVLALLEGEGDRYVVDEGDAKGMKGYFARGDDGDVSGVHLGGRLATRVAK